MTFLSMTEDKYIIIEMWLPAVTETLALYQWNQSEFLL